MQRFKQIAVCALALASILSATPQAFAQAVPSRLEVGDTLTLTLAEAQQLALRQNPQYLADRRQIDIASGTLRQARTYNFNPQLGVDAANAVEVGGVGKYEAALSQEIEWAGQWGTRVRAARFGLETAEAEVRDATRRVLADATQSFFEAMAARSRLEVTLDVMDLNRRLLQATRIQLSEGEISVMDANLAEIEVGRTRARVLAAERDYTESRLELQRLLGIPPEVHVVPTGDRELPTTASAPSLQVDSIVAVALSQRPDLLARAREIDRLSALTSLARREAIPNLEIAALAERDGVNDEPRFGIGLSVPVPLWNRNQGRVAERAAQTERAEYERQAVELAIRTEVASAVRAYETAVEEAQIYTAQVIEPSRQNQQLLDIAYREGKINLSTLILLRNQLLDAEFGYWGAWLAERQALTRLQAATGELGTDPSSLEITGANNDR